MPTAFEEVMAAGGKDMPADGEVTITGTDPVYSTKFKIGETVTAMLAGVGIAVNDIHELKTGRRQKVAITFGMAPLPCAALNTRSNKVRLAITSR